MASKLQTAEEISQNLLDKTGAALMSGDFDTFLSCFKLPQEMHTFVGKRSVSSPDDLREVFDGVRPHFKVKHVTQLIRNCIEATFREPDVVAATHMSRPIDGANLSQIPYPVFSILRCTEGVWQVAHSEYAIPDEISHSEALSGR